MAVDPEGQPLTTSYPPFAPEEPFGPAAVLPTSWSQPPTGLPARAGNALVGGEMGRRILRRSHAPYSLSARADPVAHRRTRLQGVGSFRREGPQRRLEAAGAG